MPWELIYTSAPRGLSAGQSGFCTVAQTSDLPPLTARRLEQFSYYHHLSAISGARFQINPVIATCRVVDLVGQRYHVLSRLIDAGLDFTRRTNFLAHHLVFANEEVACLPSPAVVLGRWSGWRKQWSGQPRYLPNPAVEQFRRLATQPLLPAVEWQRVTGDAGRAASLLLPQYLHGCLLRVAPGQEDSLLALFAESLELLDPDGVSPQALWNHPFTTFRQAEDSPAEFLWSGGWHGSPGTEQAILHRQTVTEAAALPVPANRLVTTARHGRATLRITAAEAHPADEPNTLISRPTRERIIIVGSDVPARPHRPAPPTALLDESEEEEEDALEEPTPPPAWVPLAGLVACGLVAGAAAWFYLQRSTPVPTPETVPAADQAADQPDSLPVRPVVLHPDPAQLEPWQGLRSHLIVTDNPSHTFRHLRSVFEEGTHAPFRLLTGLIGSLPSVKPADVQCYVLVSNQTAPFTRGATPPGERYASRQLQLGFGGISFTPGERGALDALTYKSSSGDTSWTNPFASIELEWPNPAASRNSLRLLLIHPTQPPQPAEFSLDYLVANAGGWHAFGPALGASLRQIVLPKGWAWGLELHRTSPREILYADWAEAGLNPPTFRDALQFDHHRRTLDAQIGVATDRQDAKTAQQPTLTARINALRQVDIDFGQRIGLAQSHRANRFSTFWSSLADHVTLGNAFQQYLIEVINQPEFLQKLIGIEPQHHAKRRQDIAADLAARWPHALEDLNKILVEIQVYQEHERLTQHWDVLRQHHQQPGIRDSLRDLPALERRSASIAEDLQELSSRIGRLRDARDKLPTSVAEDLHSATLMLVPDQATTPEHRIPFIHFVNLTPSTAKVENQP